MGILSRFRIILKALAAKAQDAFDEFIFLRFKPTNVEPFPFKWVGVPYSACSSRGGNRYCQRHICW